MRTILLIPLILVLASCHVDKGDTNVTGEALTRAQVRGDSAYSHVELAKPHSDPIGRVHLDSASNDLLSQHKDLDESKMALQAERDKSVKVQAAFEKFVNRIPVRIALFIDHLFWIIVVSGTLLTIGGYLIAAFVPGAGLLGGIVSHLRSILPYANRLPQR